MLASGHHSTLKGIIRAEGSLEIEHELKQIRCPVLAIATEGSALGSPGQIDAWRKHIPQLEAVTFPGNAYHVAAAQSDKAAQAALPFLLRHSSASIETR